MVVRKMKRNCRWRPRSKSEALPGWSSSNIAAMITIGFLAIALMGFTLGLLVTVTSDGFVPANGEAATASPLPR